MVEPVFSDSIPTAAVSFNRDGNNFKFEINQDFWESLNFFSQSFLISHEIMHVLLKHGSRGQHYFSNTTPSQQNHMLLNVAMDITINEILLRELNFEQDYLNFPQQGCFVNTVFKPEDIITHNIPDNESFDFYYELYEKLYNNDDEMPETYDDHSGLPDKSNDEGDSGKGAEGESSDEGSDEGTCNLEPGSSDSVIDALLESMGIDGDELDDTDNALVFGSGNDPEPSSDIIFINKKEKSLQDYVNLSIKSALYLKKKYTKKNTWYGFNRRLHGILSDIDPEISIPSSMEIKKWENDKHRILVYIDSSYSCVEYCHKFIQMIENLPKAKFFCETFTFSDNVQIVEKNKQGNYILSNPWGGTNIKAVCDHSSEKMKTEKYDAIFVLTDAIFSKLTLNDMVDAKKWFYFIIPYEGENYYEESLPLKTTRHLISDID
jgi:hypothetical protein